MRLDRFISNNLEVSRKQAQQWIKQGAVTVDDVGAKNSAMPVSEQNKVVANGVKVIPADVLYLMIHKPAGYVSATNDSKQPTVLDLLPSYLAKARDIQLVGRLDKDTTGLLLVTNDGQWNHRITSPKNSCEKCYRVGLNSPITSKAIQQLQQGLVLRNETKPTKPCRIEPTSDNEVLIYLSEGKYHQVKRMFAAVGNHVSSLHRERIGALQLPSTLAPGEFRHLSMDEVKLF